MPSVAAVCSQVETRSCRNYSVEISSSSLRGIRDPAWKGSALIADKLVKVIIGAPRYRDCITEEYFTSTCVVLVHKVIQDIAKLP